MELVTQRFMQNPLFVDAVQVTAENMAAVAEWCEGNIIAPTSDTKTYVKVNVIQPQSVRQTRAFVTDWVLKTTKGFKVYSNKAFDKSFQPVKETVNA